MRNSRSCLRRVIAFCLANILAMPLVEAAAQLPKPAIADPQPQSASSAQEQPKDSGSQDPTVDAKTSQPGATTSDSPAPAQLQAPAQSEQPAATQSASAQEQDTSPKPVGSAAAPYEKTTGVAASRPSGAVIAPGKQRRARSILIRVSIVVGAAVAVGAVVALSRTSPSRPN
jgi:cytoskeletal protein RodZ